MTSTLSVVDFIKQNDATAARIFAKKLKPTAGDLVGVRLNLNILKNTGVAVQTLHRATNKLGYKTNKGFYRGEVISYAKTVSLKNAYFNVDQAGRDAITSGKDNKHAMASVDGTFVSDDDIDTRLFNSLEIKFNPHQSHLFIDNDNKAIHYAEHVVIQGHRAYASGRIVYHNELSAPKKIGENTSIAKVNGGTIYK